VEVKAGFVSVGDMIKDTLKTVEKLYERKEMITGVPTGYDDLDKLTAGLQPSDLIIVAGRPGMGKTAFALNIATNAAFTGVGAAVFSLEMAKEQLVLRMLCSEARVNSSKVRSGYLGERDFPKLANAAGRLHDLSIYIDDTPAISVLELRAKARRLVRDRSKKIGLIVVDYLQLMRGMGGASNREQEISEISRSLKALAKELSVPVIALSQLNRRVEVFLALKFAGVYLAFGAAFTGLEIAYCNYRASAGNPSDLPCVSWLWTPMILLSWPLAALDSVLSGYAVLVSSFVVRAVGIAFLAGFLATLVTVFRRVPDSSP
jgi:archaellum biogenesis ATPase FlaH